MRIALLLLALFATGCRQATLDVETGYFTRKDLASSHVGSPDPNKQNPIFGQRLYISWNLTPKEFASEKPELHIKVRLKKDKLLSKTVPLESVSGTYIFPIVGTDYTKGGGLLSYKITLVSNGKQLAESRHKFWVEELQFSE